MPGNRKKSEMWPFVFAEDEKTKTARCNKCGRHFSKPATDTLRYHQLHVRSIQVLKIHLPKKGGNDEGNNVEEPYPNDTNQPLQGEKCAAASAAATGSSTRELSNPAATTSSRASASSSFDGPTGKCLANAVAFARGGVREKHATDALGYMIAHDDLPLSTPQKDGFKTFVKALQPLHKPPTKPAITKSLEAKYEELRAHFDRRVQAADHLSITGDVWTHANTMRSYLGLAVHFREGNKLVDIKTGIMYIPERKITPNLHAAMRQLCDE
ncbi:uncharacterized protein LOC142767786 [Rhipicephalus microplus]|uniref:uncharacterized protein LOC142767786 n=1 Tax=Rhipicephalus microplus TaxID=6941 RepID=UPI003F6B5791